MARLHSQAEMPYEIVLPVAKDVLQNRLLWLMSDEARGDFTCRINGDRITYMFTDERTAVLFKLSFG